MPVKAVLFDLGLTLTRTISFPEIYKNILASFDIKVSLDDIVQAQKAAESECNISTYNKNKRKKFWANYNIGLLEKLDIQENKEYMGRQIDELWWQFSGVQVFDDVESTFIGLRAKGLNLGLVSNGFQKDLDYVLSEFDLKKWFDVIVCIDSCNCAKPNKEIFLYALNKLGIRADEAVFVGDSVLYDYIGASRVGITPFLIDREGKFSGDYDTISSLSELLDIL